MSTRLTLGEYVRHRRRRKRWGLQDVSRATGLSVSHLSRIENDNAVPNAESVVKLAGALDGDLEQMLELADCLPHEILERLIRRADARAASRRRSAGDQLDQGFPKALVEEIDPALRAGLAKHFGLSERDVDGLFSVLQRMARMSPSERDAVIGFLASAAWEEVQ